MKNANSKKTYLDVRNITKSFGKYTALNDISFTADSGEFISILGPSGCGKTTLLRTIAGLEKQCDGKIYIEGRDVSKLPVSKRNVGIVFQSYALFPNLTAEQNIAYGLKNQRKNRSEVKKRCDELLELVGLSGMGEKYPAQMSGGQQQRVALARAMALSPDLLLLDEPLSALDAKVRSKLRTEIRELQRRLNITTIMVTHDQEEALTMADKILVMNKGNLVQCGTPNQIYERPATPFVADFIGSMNFIESVEKKDKGLYGIGSHDFRVYYENGASVVENGEKVLMAIRPEDVRISKESSHGTNEVVSHIKSMEYRGSVFRLAVGLSNVKSTGVTFEADIPTSDVIGMDLKPDMQVSLTLPTERIWVYHTESGIIYN